MHQALSTLGIDRYVLAGHSVAGIYALEYTNTYPDEVQAFVGIVSVETPPHFGQVSVDVRTAIRRP